LDAVIGGDVGADEVVHLEIVPIGAIDADGLPPGVAKRRHRGPSDSSTGTCDHDRARLGHSCSISSIR
jgi:hypothetical protein